MAVHVTSSTGRVCASDRAAHAVHTVTLPGSSHVDCRTWEANNTPQWHWSFMRWGGACLLLAAACCSHLKTPTPRPTFHHAEGLPACPLLLPACALQALAGRHYNEQLHGLLTAAGSTVYLVEEAHRTLVLHEVGVQGRRVPAGGPGNVTHT